jgi:hypothetical protein
VDHRGLRVPLEHKAFPDLKARLGLKGLLVRRVRKGLRAHLDHKGHKAHQGSLGQPA